MARLRVGFVQASLEVGGAERLVQRLVEGMDPAVVEPMVFNLFQPGAIGERLQAAGVPVLSHLLHSRTDAAAPWKLATALRARRVDVVHVIDSALPLFWIGVLRRLRWGPRFVLGVHSTQWTDRAARSAFARMAAVGAADRVVALTETHRALLLDVLGVRADRCVVIRSGVDLARFDPAVAREEARRRAGLPEDGLLVGIVASLRPVKNHALLLRAFARVAATHPRARLLVVGDGPEREAIERFAGEHGLADRVLLTGVREDVPLLYRAMDVAVLTSHSEALPVSLIEAAACATPSVATRVGSVPDVVVDGETGWVVEPGDEAAFAARLAGLLDDPARRERFGAAARARVERLFDERTMLGQFAELFAAVAAGHA